MLSNFPSFFSLILLQDFTLKLSLPLLFLFFLSFFTHLHSQVFLFFSPLSLPLSLTPFFHSFFTLWFFFFFVFYCFSSLTFTLFLTFSLCLSLFLLLLLNFFLPSRSFQSPYLFFLSLFLLFLVTHMKIN